MNTGWQSDADRFAVYITSMTAIRYDCAERPGGGPPSPVQRLRRKTAEMMRTCLPYAEGVLR